MARLSAGNALLTLVVAQVVVSGALAFVPSVVLRAGAEGSVPQAKGALPQKPILNRPRSSVLKLSASSSLVVDPEASWAQYNAGDSALLASIAPSLTLLTPGTGEQVKLGDLVGDGKGLVVFMRHIG